jgi:ferrous iron transport protein B
MLVTMGKFGIGTVVAFAIVLGFIYLLVRPYGDDKAVKVSNKRLAKG